LLLRGSIAVSLAIAVALAGAVAWGLVAILINLQLSLFGLLIGAGVGAVVAKYRPGHRPTIIAGAVIAVAGCALGTYLTMVFQELKDSAPLSYVLGHLGGGPYGLLHYYPHQVGWLGLLFWAVAAYAAIRIPLQRQRSTASAAALTPVWGQTPSSAGSADDGLATESAQPMFVKPPEPEPGSAAGSSTTP
jgi:hypothetical protein